MKNALRKLTLLVLGALFVGCAAQPAGPAITRGEILSSDLPVTPGNLAWAAEVVDGDASYVYLVELDVTSGVLSAGKYFPSTETAELSFEAPIEAHGGAHRIAGDAPIGLDISQGHLVLDGRTTVLEAIPTAGAPVRLVRVGETSVRAMGDIAGAQESIVPKYQGCCIDCYNTHRRLGLPKSWDRFCCLIGGGCESWEFPCDPDTSPDGCECDPYGECLPEIQGIGF